MVETLFIHKVLKNLEKYLIKKNNYNLLGHTYDLILLIPSDKYFSDTKYSLIISLKQLNNFNQKDVIKELLLFIKENLNEEEYAAITRINILHSEDSFVKNLNYMFAHREEVIEIEGITVGGMPIEFAYLVKSLILDKLIEGRALKLEFINGKSINAGIIRIEKDFNVVYYTGKGLREIWKPDMTEEERVNAEFLNNQSESYLLEHQYMMKTPLDDIVKVR